MGIKELQEDRTGKNKKIKKTNTIVKTQISIY